MRKSNKRISITMVRSFVSDSIEHSSRELPMHLVSRYRHAQTPCPSWPTNGNPSGLPFDTQHREFPCTFVEVKSAPRLPSCKKMAQACSPLSSVRRFSSDCVRLLSNAALATFIRTTYTASEKPKILIKFLRFYSLVKIN